MLARTRFDELFFLSLAKEFVRGDYEFVRRLSREFPWLNVADEVRALFVRPDGESVLRAR